MSTNDQTISEDESDLLNLYQKVLFNIHTNWEQEHCDKMNAIETRIL